MKLIHELLEELTEIAREYNADLIDKIELDLKIRLIISRIDRIEINFTDNPLQKLVVKRHTKPFNQQLFKSKYKAIQSLLTLQKVNNKRSFNNKLSFILANKLFFNSLYRILDNSCKAYISRNHLNLIQDNIRVFIYIVER